MTQSQLTLTLLRRPCRNEQAIICGVTQIITNESAAKLIQSENNDIYTTTIECI